LIGWIADTQSNGARAKRHIQDNLFSPLGRGVIGWTPPS
jgi:hypothetical protein